MRIMTEYDRIIVIIVFFLALVGVYVVGTETLVGKRVVNSMRRHPWPVELAILFFALSPTLPGLMLVPITLIYGCEVNEGGYHPCVILGTDMGHIFYDLLVTGWFSLLTVPMGICIGILWALLKRQKG